MKSLRKTIFGVNLLFYFSLAITTYINSSFIEKEIGENYVGIIYSLSALLTIWLHARATKDIARIGNRRYFLLFAFVQALCLSILIVPVPKMVHAMTFVTYLITTNVIIFTLDIFFERVLGKQNQGKKRGLFLLLGNAGYVLAPLITAALVNSYGYSGSYLFALFILIFLITIVLSKMGTYTDAKYTIHPMSVVFHKVFMKKSLKYVVLSNFLLQFFYSWMIVYAPILLHTHMGLSWSTIGLIFSIMLTTFVILDYPLGYIADKIGSEKELSAIGFIIMAIASFLLAFIPTLGVILIGLIFFISRIGAATVEAMTEIHFFKSIKDGDSAYISIFRDLRPFAYLIAPVIGGLLLPFVPLKSSFAILGGVMIIGFFVSLKIDQTKSWWAREHNK